MAYDRARGVTVLFGGLDGGQQTGAGDGHRASSGSATDREGAYDSVPVDPGRCRSRRRHSLGAIPGVDEKRGGAGGNRTL